VSCDERNVSTELVAGELEQMPGDVVETFCRAGTVQVQGETVELTGLVQALLDLLDEVGESLGRDAPTGDGTGLEDRDAVHPAPLTRGLEVAPDGPDLAQLVEDRLTMLDAERGEMLEGGQ